MSASMKNTTRKPNRGSFRPGPDARRNVFTTEERRRYQNAMNEDNAHVDAWVFPRVRGYYRAVRRAPCA